MRIKILVLSLVCLFFISGCEKNLPTSPDIPELLLPTIVYFRADPREIDPGKSSGLSWSVTGATKVEINQGIGIVEAQGSVEVTPSTSGHYILTATNEQGTIDEGLVIEVRNFLAWVPFSFPSISMSDFCLEPVISLEGTLSNTSYTKDAYNIVLHVLPTSFDWTFELTFYGGQSTCLQRGRGVSVVLNWPISREVCRQLVAWGLHEKQKWTTRLTWDTGYCRYP